MLAEGLPLPPPPVAVAATIAVTLNLIHARKGLMIATRDSIAPHSTDPLPNSARVYVSGKIHSDLRVPFREIHLQPTKSFAGQLESNEPVRVYDTSGPWGDESFAGAIERGLAPHRHGWIMARGDVENYSGRPVQPQDNVYLTRGHSQFASARETSGRPQPFPGLKREPVHAR